MSSALEPAMSAFLSDVSEVLHATLPEGTLQDHEVDGRCPAEASRCYQYPKLRPGVKPLSSHQVAIRGPRGRASMHESDREAYMSTSDLHLDPCDGGGRIGSCTIHTCHPNTLGRSNRKQGTTAPKGACSVPIQNRREGCPHKVHGAWVALCYTHADRGEVARLSPTQRT